MSHTSYKKKKIGVDENTNHLQEKTMLREKLLAFVSHDKSSNCKETKTIFGSGIEEVSKD